MWTKLIGTILDIDSFDQQCVIIKGLLQSEQLKQHMVIIVVDQSLINSALYEHIFLEDIKNYKIRPVNVMINISTRQLLNPPWYPILRDLLTTFQCNLAHLCL